MFNTMLKIQTIYIFVLKFHIENYKFLNEFDDYKN